MKILHTADWHLGAHLGPFSRINEQKLFLEQLIDIVDEKAIDMVIIAGDIFDSPNPPAAAEALFFHAAASLAARKIPIILVAGNHDNAERLAAPIPMAAQMGVLIFATPHSQPPARSYANFSVSPLAPCCVELTFSNLGCQVILSAMPFVSEKRLGEAIFTAKDEAGMQKDYSAKIGELFSASSKFFREDTINIAAGHFHIAGGEASRGLERDIILGGSFAVNPSHMPPADYIAMGHLHRPQKLKCGGGGKYLAHYAGSPLPYSLSEQGYPKGVYIADLKPGQPAVVEKIPLNCPKPIELWEFETTAQAIEKCQQPSSAYKYIRIAQADVNPHDIKEMRRTAPDIVSIEIAQSTGLQAPDYNSLHILNPREEFVNFYTKSTGSTPARDVLSLFDEILHNENEEQL